MARPQLLAPPSDLHTWGPNGPCASDVDEPAADDDVASSLLEMGVLVLSEREIGLHLFLIDFWWLNCPTQIIGLTSLL
jgi:hypothetical protein